MRRIFWAIFLLFFTFCITACTADDVANKSAKIGMPNPWTDCNEDLDCAKRAAGFGFPLKLSEIKVRAMKDIIEITYPLDEARIVTIRKAAEELYNKTGISGDYNNYPIKDKMILKNGVEFLTRRDENLIYVAYFGAQDGFYSINCTKGITKQELEKIYEIIATVEN